MGKPILKAILVGKPNISKPEQRNKQEPPVIPTNGINNCL